MNTAITNQFENLYKKYSLNSDIILKDAFHSFLLDKKRKYLIELNEILRKYKVQNIKELEKIIKSSKKLEHPGWEDLIDSENLIFEIQQLENDIKSVR